MKKLFVTMLCFVPFMALSQKHNEYKASNGKIYHIGDTVRVGMGSMPNGDFKYIQINLPLFMPPQRNNNLNARKDFSGTYAIIKKIKSVNQNAGAEKIIFTTKTGGIPTFDIWIENAIAACEVIPCVNEKNNTSAPISVADELIKLKKLLDDGAITKTEFNAQKRKILAD